MKALVHFSRIFIGLVFTYSGYVKIVDPLGTVYKFGDYFEAFNLMFLNPLATPLAVVMCAAELIFGITLIFNIKSLWSTWGVLLFMSVFTPLTLVLALFNPVSDCGCFGEALILTNWETFWKNVVITIFIIFLFIKRKTFSDFASPKADIVYFSIISVAVVLLGVFSLNTTPIVDFRPYHIGANIQEGMTVPADAPQDVYKYNFIYKNKNSEKTQEFTEENYPWNDTLQWEFVSMETVLVKKGYEAPIHDLTIQTIYLSDTQKYTEGQDVTDMILDNSSYTFWLVAHNLQSSNEQALVEANKIAEFCRQKNYNFLCLTSTNAEVIGEIKNRLKLDYHFYNTDEITLKTIVRSNPGLVLIKDGTVLNKWHYNNFPTVKQLDTNLLASSLKEQNNKKERRLTIILSLVVILGIYVIYNVHKSRNKNRKEAE